LKLTEVLGGNCVHNFTQVPRRMVPSRLPHETHVLVKRKFEMIGRHHHASELAELAGWVDLTVKR
jgi:hypothetical protein